MRSENQSAILNTAALFDQLPFFQKQRVICCFFFIGVPELGGGYTDSRLDLTVFSQRDRHAADLSGGFLANREDFI